MSGAGDADGGRQERLHGLILEYVDAIESGRSIDREQFIQSHSEFRLDLEAFFAAHDEVECVFAPLRVAGVAPHSGSGPRSGQLSRLRSGLSTRHPAVVGQLGEYRLIKEIGRGGMGVVYEAEQLSLQRRVALKVLPFAATIDVRQLQRFKNEALAAASLRHEHIVSVYGVGCELGVHYYAMQLIEGQSLAELIAELRRRGSECGEPSAAARSTVNDAAETKPASQFGPLASAPCRVSMTDSRLLDRGSVQRPLDGTMTGWHNWYGKLPWRWIMLTRRVLSTGTSNLQICSSTARRAIVGD